MCPEFAAGNVIHNKLRQEVRLDALEGFDVLGEILES